MSTRRFLAALIAVLSLAVVSACARPDTTTAGSARAGSPASASQPTVSPSPVPTVVPTSITTSGSATASASAPPTLPGGSPPTAIDGDITISGTVSAGAEPSCLLLTANKVEYLLLLSNSQHAAAGQSLKVTGHVVTGIMTHCMQGMPFQVTKMSPAG